MGVKISELQEKTTADNTDVLPIVDTTGGTKKITKANFLKGINLYENESGTNSNITLSDQITNYTEYEIKYLGENGEPYTTGKLNTGFVDRIHLTGIFLGVPTGPGALVVNNARVSISGNILSWISNRKYIKPYNSGAEGGSYEESTGIKIVEIIGYK